MAKSNGHQEQDENQGSDNGARTLVVQGLTFQYEPRYAEGHQLTAVEAAALNGLLGENLRNNFATTVKKAVENQPRGADDKPQPFSQEQLESLQAQFTDYASKYTFSGTRAPRAPVDPVEREAIKMAKTIVTNALKSKNYDIKSLPEGKMDEMISSLLTKNPTIRAKAREHIEALNAIATEAVADIASSGGSEGQGAGA